MVELVVRLVHVGRIASSWRLLDDHFLHSNQFRFRSRFNVEPSKRPCCAEIRKSINVVVVAIAVVDVVVVVVVVVVVGSSLPEDASKVENDSSVHNNPVMAVSCKYNACTWYSSDGEGSVPTKNGLLDKSSNRK